MLQTVCIIIHLMLIALVYWKVGRTNDIIRKNSNPLYYDGEEVIDVNKIKILFVKEFCLVGLGVCLNLAIFYWLEVNRKPEWYANYMWFVLLVPLSIFIATLFSGLTDKTIELIQNMSGLASFFILIICIFVTIFGVTVPGNPEQTITRINIENVSDSEKQSAVYSVNGNAPSCNVYTYYYRGENNEIKQAVIPANESKIYYLQEGETQGYIKKITTTRYEYNVNSYPAIKTDKVVEQSEKYEIHIPSGSIKTY